MKLFRLELREIVREEHCWVIRWRLLVSSASRATIERYKQLYAISFQEKHLRIIKEI